MTLKAFSLTTSTAATHHDNDSDRWQGMVEDAGYPAPSGDTTDGEMEDMSLIIGGNFENGRGNATAYATYRKIKPIWAGDRDYSACALSDNVDGCAGSSTTPQGRFIAPDGARL